MSNPFATLTMEDLTEDATRLGTYVLKGTPAIRGRDPVGTPADSARPPYWPFRSRTEQRYADILTHRQHEGQVRRWWYEPLKLRLGEKCYYTADFLVLEETRPYELLLVETKGSRVWEDAVVKTKTAARMYPCFVFVWAQWKSQTWTERVIRPT